MINLRIGDYVHWPCPSCKEIRFFRVSVVRISVNEKDDEIIIKCTECNEALEMKESRLITADTDMIKDATEGRR